MLGCWKWCAVFHPFPKVLNWKTCQLHGHWRYSLIMLQSHYATYLDIVENHTFVNKKNIESKVSQMLLHTALKTQPFTNQYCHTTVITMLTWTKPTMSIAYMNNSRNAWWSVWLRRAPIALTEICLSFRLVLDSWECKLCWISEDTTTTCWLSYHSYHFCHS